MSVPSGPPSYASGVSNVNVSRCSSGKPRRRDVRDDADDDVHRALEARRQRREQIALIGLDAVAALGHGALVDVGGHDARGRAPGVQHRGDRPAAGAQSIATPASGRHAAARSASGSLCQRGT